MDKNIESLIGSDELKIIKQRQQEALDKELYGIAVTTVKYLNKEKKPFYEREKWMTINGTSSSYVVTTFKEKGLTITYFEFSLIFRTPAAVRIEYDNQLVFECHADNKVKKHLWGDPITLDVLAYIPGKKWEEKLHECHAKAEALKREELNLEEKEEKRNQKREAEETLDNFGL